jgi:hypothetical protein
VLTKGSHVVFPDLSRFFVRSFGGNVATVDGYNRRMARPVRRRLKNGDVVNLVSTVIDITLDGNRGIAVQIRATGQRLTIRLMSGGQRSHFGGG